MVFLYGPPAAGKFTVAVELGRLTGFKVFHNHLTFDAVAPVFEFGTPPFGRLLRSMREAVLKEAAREDVSLILTSVYAHPQDVGYMEAMCAAVEDNGGRVHLVQLLCGPAELEARVVADHRVNGSKLSDVERLRQLLRDYDVVKPMPGRESLCIDNTHLPPDEVARRIIDHFGLQKVSLQTGGESGFP